MIIGIDGNEANVEKRVGIGEYNFELLRQFKEFPLSNIKFQIYLKNPPLASMPVESENWKYRIVGPKKLWTQIGLPFDLFTHSPRPDVFFTPTHYAPRFCPVPSVISVMDLSYLYFPELFKAADLYQLKNWTAYSVRNARKIFTISDASKNDIIKWYKVPSERVVVAYPGIKGIPSSGIKKYTMSGLDKKFGVSSPYILFVSTLQPRKNIVRLIEAFSQLKSKKSLELVIVGKKGWLYEEILHAPAVYGVSGRVKFLDFVLDEDLPSLYSHAQFFILPSLYEGFGLPILEAMKYGCPVITSNVSSLPEVGGDAALYVNPLDVADISEKMQEILDNDSLRKKLIEAGKKQILKFSWEKSAKKTLDVLRDMVGGSI